MFLTPETEFAITVKTKIEKKGDLEVPAFTVEEGGSLKLRTATGREYQRLLLALRDPDAAFDIVPKFLVSGIKPEDVERLHPAVVQLLMQEILKRSRLDEASRGN